MSSRRTWSVLVPALVALVACEWDDPRSLSRAAPLIEAQLIEAQLIEAQLIEARLIEAHLIEGQEPPAAMVRSSGRVDRSARASSLEPVVTARARIERVELVYPSRYQSAVEFPGSLAAADRATWRHRVPEVEAVSIESTLDGAPQRALFYDSGSQRQKPLLVVLHSWSAGYLQNAHIPYASFAVANDWVFVHPDFRGRNRRPEATVSELAVQDVLDAVDWARANANVDESRIYLLGYSAGAMMALVLAGREPDRWAGVVAWVAVFDLVDWYEHTRRRGSRYAREIAVSCGGAPRPHTRAASECTRRSPVAHLHRASGRTPVFIAHGVRDRLAPPGHAVRAFNALAAPEQRISDADHELIVEDQAVPRRLGAEGARTFDVFDAVGKPVVLERTSRGATLVLFDGDHDMLYRPGLRWLAAQRRGALGSEPSRAQIAWADERTDRDESSG